MRIGVVRERHADESRVALGPYAVNELTSAGHRVVVEAGAGVASGIPDERYREAGAVVAGEVGRVYEESELLVKVYAPSPEEYPHLREGMVLLAFLSLPVNPEPLERLLESRCVAIAAEAIRNGRGTLPILTPMSEIGGRLVPQIGAHYLQYQAGGRGILLGGSVGVRPGRVVILGAGTVGSAAARVASGLGADVTVLDRDLDRLRDLEGKRLRGVNTLASSGMAIEQAVPEADLLIGAVHIASSRTPALVDRETVARMKPGAVIVDVDVDNGGCVETSRPTTLSEPVFSENGVTHYCVRNIPASVPVTATRALSNALLPYVRSLAGLGLPDALNADAGLRRGVAVAEGRVVDPVLARTTGQDHTPVSAVIPLHREVR
ncbi:alaDH: alanine dehydrogenase [Rubrobacter radiotolerans]|uniref:alanine dehydrogenase n=1 Tax=Rubrobacter radiotolerans TaxID=42256 RepID=A0A023X3V8_RUBRA|nr:alanine dehydrogenase [Rubrobacter radiotolerans]AHY46734.1 alaDH: alanine dehydrogenase [Rubrobacter radiotolerans]MDX5894141.1 alanine dehydrogenase [Rubrobacter radiotolerans]SMC05294.1 alanine dehydrogenase [Rubrobacter radiotolerans DSM 5868]